MLVLNQRISLPLVLLLSAATAAPGRMQCGGRNPAQQEQNGKTTGQAIYFLTNDAENAVVALPIADDGTLSQGTVIPTGGAGSNAIDGKTNEPIAPDALVGQSALAVVGQNLFAVNAGSNTLTMMSISADDPTSLTMIGQPAPVPGEFPMTVAASAEHKLACVGTTGAVNGISCATFSANGLGDMDDLRPFNIDQSTPPVGPTNTVSHTFFSADESVLLTTVKGDPAVNNTGFVSTFAVEQSSYRRAAAQLSRKEIRSSPDGTAVLFGSSTIPGNGNSIFATDASFGAAILSFNKRGQASVISAQAIDGQKATCWTTISEKTNSAFVTDVGVNRIVEMSLDDASIISELDLSDQNADPGLIDLKAVGDFVYALSPGNGTTKAAVTVLDVSGGQDSMQLAQHFELGGVAGKNAQGMAAMA